MSQSYKKLPPVTIEPSWLAGTIGITVVNLFVFAPLLVVALWALLSFSGSGAMASSASPGESDAVQQSAPALDPR